MWESCAGSDEPDFRQCLCSEQSWQDESLAIQVDASTIIYGHNARINDVIKSANEVVAEVVSLLEIKTS